MVNEHSNLYNIVYQYLKKYSQPTHIMKILFIFCTFILFSLTMVNAQRTKPFDNSEYIRLDGIDIHYRQWLPTSTAKGNVLLVHGFGGSTFCWRKNVQALTAAGFHVFALDLPPFGFSDTRRGINHSLSAQALICLSFMEKMDSTQKWHLIGHSMGGAIVSIMGAHAPEVIQSIVITDGALFDKNRNLNGFLRFLLQSKLVHSVGEIAGKYYFYKYPRIEQMLVGAYGQKPEEEAVTGYLNGLKNPGTAGGIMEMSGAKNVFSYNLKEVKAPCLMIWGEADKWVPVTEYEKVKLYFPTPPPLITIAGAAHCPMETHSNLYNEYVIAFLLKNL